TSRRGHCPERRCTRFHSQARATAAVLPMPVGTEISWDWQDKCREAFVASTGAGAPQARRDWKGYGLFPVAARKNSSKLVDWSWVMSLLASYLGTGSVGYHRL